MPTNLHIDPQLLADAVVAGNHSTKRDAVNSALKEYVGHRRRQKILELFGTIEYEPGYEPTEVRKRLRRAMAAPGKKRKRTFSSTATSGRCVSVARPLTIPALLT